MFKKSINVGDEELVGVPREALTDFFVSKVPPFGLLLAVYRSLERPAHRVVYVPYQAGDIVGVMGGAMSQLTSRIFAPRTRLYHFLIIGDYIPQEDDYVIYEAIASGVRTGRLSWYAEDLYVVFRIGDPQSATLGLKASREASAFGRWGYDFLMYPLIVKDLLGIYARMIFKERKLRRVRPEELTYRENHAFICTEFANACYRSGERPPVPQGETPIPASYIKAYLDGKLTRVGSNTPDKYRYVFYSRDILPNYQSSMPIVCGWCDKPMGVKDGAGNTGTTTGICAGCEAKLNKEGAGGKAV